MGGSGIGVKSIWDRQLECARHARESLSQFFNRLSALVVFCFAKLCVLLRKTRFLGFAQKVSYCVQ